MTLLPLYLLAILGITGFIWQSNLHAREIAAKIAIDTCRAQNYQLLDGGAVILQRLKVTRNHSGSIKLQRSYRFDYSSDGVNRQQGFIILIGYELDNVGLSTNLDNHNV